jgi:hypothetical protein
MAGTLGSANVTNLHRACAVLGVTHEEIAARAGCSRPLVTLALQGRKRLSERIKTATVDLCRERLGPHVADVEAILAAMLAEAGGVDAELDAMRDAVADLKRTAKRLEVAQ